MSITSHLSTLKVENYGMNLNFLGKSTQCTVSEGTDVQGYI